MNRKGKYKHASYQRPNPKYAPRVRVKNHRGKCRGRSK